ncbi:MAG: CocE/NonD family hydrolase [Actinomycetota bacterium]|nr:CocE/NonD family hydrolase [Actinomycetota bacterium]
MRVPMADGVELALTTYRPDAPGAFPAVVESLPYRKDDDCFSRDWQTFSYLAARGIAGVRVDIRGTGASDGIAAGEYLPIEQDDNIAVMEWLADQPWCTGRLGMWGISWGGFSALQTAMRRPPMLQAICAMHATHDRFATDVHYIGGALHLLEQMDWPVGMLVQNLLPPDPDIVGDRWLEMWRRRLATTPQWLPEWLSHQTRDGFWRHGSPCEDYRSITAPTLLVGGWLDPYVEGMLELLANLDVPRRAVIGPWGHYRPATGIPGPTLDHFDLLARWFGHWLADEDTGVMDDPLLTMYVRHGPPFDPTDGAAAGRWRAEPAWPPLDLERRLFHLDQGHLDRGHLGAGPAGADSAVSWQGPWTLGTASPAWDLGGVGSTDTTADDAAALVWETEPLSAPVEILGRVEVTVTVEVDRPGGRLVVHLVDVAPDGSSWFVTRGVLNLSHRDDMSAPVATPTGVPFPVTLTTVPTSAVFAAGHRIRVTLAGTDFPVVLPPPHRVRLTIHTGPSRPGVVCLPVVGERLPDRDLDIASAVAPPAPGTWLRDVAGHKVERLAIGRRVSRHVDSVELQPETGPLTYRWRQDTWVEGDDAVPAHVTAGATATTGLQREGWAVAAFAEVTLTVDATDLHLAMALRVTHDEREVWADRIDATTTRVWT